jgi:hypothetical protein
VRGSLIFDGRLYSDGDLLPTLQKAAHGNVQASDPNMVLNPDEWVMPFVHAAKQSTVRDALVVAVDALLRSRDPVEARLGAFIASRTVATTNASVITDSLIAARSAGNQDLVRELASALHGVSREPDFTYDARVRDVALDDAFGSSRAPLLAVIVRHDRPWFVANAAALLGHDESEACMRVDLVAVGFPKDEINRIGTDVVRSLRSASSPLADAVQEEFANLSA